MTCDAVLDHLFLHEGADDMEFSRDRFIEIEEMYRLNDLNYQGFHYWNHLRTEVYREMKRMTGALAAQSKAKKTRREKWSDLSRVFYNAYLRPQRLKKNVDILFRVHPRRIKNGNVYCSSYTDGLIDLYPNSLCIENSYLSPGFHHRPAREKLYYLDRFGFEAELWAKWQRKDRTGMYRELRREISENLTEPIKKLYETIGVEPELNREIEQFTIFTLSDIRLMKYYSRLLKTVNPKLVVEVIGYSKESAVLTECARRLGIRTIELQHGQIYRDHMAYQYPEKANVPSLPDYFFSFADYWSELTSFPHGQVKCISTGFPYFEEERIKFPAASKKGGGGRRTLLFLCNNIGGEELTRTAVILGKTLDPERFQIVCKMHPNQYQTWRAQFPWLADAAVRIIDTPSPPLYQLLSEADIQVGTTSTSIFEGFGYGLETYILKCDENRNMQELEKKGIVNLFSDAKELSVLLGESGRRNSTPDPQYFWRENALANMKEQIDAILKNA